MILLIDSLNHFFEPQLKLGRLIHLLHSPLLLGTLVANSGSIHGHGPMRALLCRYLQERLRSAMRSRLQLRFLLIDDASDLLELLELFVFASPDSHTRLPYQLRHAWPLFHQARGNNIVFQRL